MTPIAGLSLADIEGLCERATPGPWYQCGLPWFQTGSGVLAGNPDPHAGALIVDCESWDGEREEMIADHPHLKIADPDDDAAFIAASRTLVPALVQRIRELEAALVRIQGVADWRDIPIDTPACSRAIFQCSEMHEIVSAALPSPPAKEKDHG